MYANDKSFRKQVNTVSKNVENDRGRIYEIDGILETLKKIKEKYHGGKQKVDILFIAFETDVNEVLQGYKDDSEKLKGKKEERRKLDDEIVKLEKGSPEN